MDFIQVQPITHDARLEGLIGLEAGGRVWYGEVRRTSSGKQGYYTVKWSVIEDGSPDLSTSR